MIYRPSPGSRLWDTWLFAGGERYHLFHIQGEEGAPGHGGDQIGHAVSTDLLHWETWDTIPTRGPKGAWDDSNVLTGMIVPREGEYVMLYGGRQDEIQRVGLLLSEDLRSWQKYAGNPVLTAGEPYYQSAPTPELPWVDWRDPHAEWIPELRRYEVVICARARHYTEGIGACIGRAASHDLIDWELLPPFAVTDFMQMEVPGHFSLNGHHYLLFSSHEGRGSARHTPSRDSASGTFYLRSRERETGYETPDDPLLIGSGQGRFDNYVGRVILVADGYLLYHHMCGPRPAFAAPKLVLQAPDGSLSLGYWPALDGLETEVIRDGFRELCPKECLGGYGGRWRTEGEQLLGVAPVMQSVLLAPETTSDFSLTCTVQPPATGRAGLVFRFDREGVSGAQVLLDGARGCAEIGEIEEMGRGLGFVLWDRVSGVLRGGVPVEIRLLVRAEFVDVYLDGRWAFSTVLEGMRSCGQIGLAAEHGEAVFSQLRVTAVEPLL